VVRAPNEKIHGAKSRHVAVLSDGHLYANGQCQSSKAAKKE
jgi:hypothetical protein